MKIRHLSLVYSAVLVLEALLLLTPSGKALAQSEAERRLALRFVPHYSSPLKTDSISVCQYQLNEGSAYQDSSDFMPQNMVWPLRCYDTLQNMVEQCTSFPDAYYAFSYMINAADALDRITMDTSWTYNYRLWLESVLYTNTADSEYFCADVRTIVATFYDINQNVAILRWLEQNTDCDSEGVR